MAKDLIRFESEAERRAWEREVCLMDARIRAEEAAEQKEEAERAALERAQKVWDDNFSCIAYIAIGAIAFYQCDGSFFLGAIAGYAAFCFTRST